MRKFKIIGMLTVILYLLLFFLSKKLGEIDYNRILNEKNPMFSLPIMACGDGGTITYFGIGYYLTSYHRMKGKGNKLIGYDIGPEIKYTWRWFWPFISNLRKDKKEIYFKHVEKEL